MTKDPNGSTVASVQMEVTASDMVLKAAFRMRASPSVGERKLQKSTSSVAKGHPSTELPRSLRTMQLTYVRTLLRK